MRGSIRAMKTVTTIRELRLATAAWHQRNETIGFVPTMGALHSGHCALVRKAQSLAKHVVVSIFVNPLQFGPNEDFTKYPRQMEADKKKLEAVGCDILFAPTPEEMYPAGFSTNVDPGPLAKVLEGAVRPVHFAGVATVVTKLLLLVMPDYACFGEKDYQQLQVVERIVRDLALPTQIVGVPIVRDKDGLALSSRNAYLTPDERARAVAVPHTLEDIAVKLRDGADFSATLEAGRARLALAGFTVDYLTLADQETLETLSAYKPRARLLVAAKIGATRLLDNRAV